MKKHILTLLLNSICLTATAYTNPQESQALFEKALTQHEVEGWCSLEKANMMYNLILETKPTVCVEIGSFGGASILPCALALKENNHGIIYAIDPYTNFNAVEFFDNNSKHYTWWNSIDFEVIYEKFMALQNDYDFKNFCKTLRMTSLEAINHIPNSIDILHIDGDHNEISVFREVQAYLPKVKKNGYIWMDDIFWPFCPKEAAEARSKGEKLTFALNKSIDYLEKNGCIKILTLDNGNCTLYKKYSD